MAEKEFFEGERIVIERSMRKEEIPEKVQQPIIGTISSIYLSTFPDLNIYSISGDDGRKYELNSGGILRKETSVGTSFSIGGDYSIRRLNPQDLGKSFEKRLSEELGLVKKLAKAQDETHRAATIATLQNLTRYLSSEIDRAYKQAESLAMESDETGRAAALATLRNLNTYLTERQDSKARTA